LESSDSSEDWYRWAVGAVFLRIFMFGKIYTMRAPIKTSYFAISNHGTT
jgi:hypothetical protein